MKIPLLLLKTPLFTTISQSAGTHDNITQENASNQHYQLSSDTADCQLVSSRLSVTAIDVLEDVKMKRYRAARRLLDLRRKGWDEKRDGEDKEPRWETIKERVGKAVGVIDFRLATSP